MTDEESGSCRKRKSRQPPAPSDDNLEDAKIEPLQPEDSDSRLEKIDWDKARFTAYAITEQVQVVKEIEEHIKQQFRAMSKSEWADIPDVQEVARAKAHTLAIQWVFQNIDWRPLKIYIFNLTHRMAAVDEITQTIMESLLRKPAESWVEIEDRAQYLKTMVFNAASDWKKSEGSQQYKAAAAISESNQVHSQDTGDLATRACAAADAHKLLRKLRGRVREAYQLHKGWGFSAKETATFMGVSEETVKGYIKEALREFQKLTDHQANLRRTPKRGRREDQK